MKLTFYILFFLSVSSVCFAQVDVQKGKKLFYSNCAACHKLDKRLVGPALGNISTRRKLAWTIAFIKDSKDMILKGDKEAIAIYEEYNKIPMIGYSFLSDAEIKSIIAYLDSYKD